MRTGSRGYSAAPRSEARFRGVLQCAEFHSLPDLVNLALTFEQSDTLARGRASNMVNELHQYTLSKRSMVTDRFVSTLWCGTHIGASPASAEHGWARACARAPTRADVHAASCARVGSIHSECLRVRGVNQKSSKGSVPAAQVVDACGRGRVARPLRARPA